MRRSWLIALLCMPASAATLVEGPTAQVNGSTIVKSYPAPGLDACKADIALLATGQKRYCRTQFTVSTPSAPPTVWTLAAYEETGSKKFTIYTTAQVRFGLAPKWATFTKPAGTYDCNIPTFGDPFVGADKQCEVSPASALVAPPAPPPTPAVGVALLTWAVPTKNTDGSTLTNLAGFKVYHGTSPGALTDVITVPGATVTSYTIGQLVSGTHYFAVTAYTASGQESAKSTVGSKTIP